MTERSEIETNLQTLQSIGIKASLPSKEVKRLVELLSKRSDIYKGRRVRIAQHIRALIFTIVAESGAPKSALPFIVDELSTYDNTFSGAHGFVAAAMAAATLGAEGKPTVKPLMRALRSDFTNHGVSTEYIFSNGYGGSFTTPRMQAIVAMGKLGPIAREALPALKAFIEQKKVPQQTKQADFLREQEEAKKTIKHIENK